jgi:hypothetical protein
MEIFLTLQVEKPPDPHYHPVMDLLVRPEVKGKASHRGQGPVLLKYRQIEEKKAFGRVW